MKTFTIIKKKSFFSDLIGYKHLRKFAFLFAAFILLNGFVSAQNTVTVSGGSTTGAGANGTYYYTGTTNVDGSDRRYYDQPAPSTYRIEYRFNTNPYVLTNEWEVWESTDRGGSGTVRFYNSSNDVIIPSGTWEVDVASGNPIISYTLNSAPTDISLSSTSISENVAPNTVVGTLSTTDPDAGDSFTYNLVAGTGDTDNASFTISGTNLRINSSPDFETKSSYSIRIQTDDGTETYSKAFTITINDINEAPMDISLSNSAIDENIAANSTIGTFSTTDPDAGNTFTYNLVAGTGDTDNASFTISGANLQINSSPDFETKSSYSIRIQTDDGTNIYSKPFTITINDINEAPTDISLSNSAIDENIAANSTIGTFSATDPDAGNTFTYNLVAGIGDADNASFTISGNNLLINATPDYETKNNYSIRVQVTDQGGLSYEKTFTITINDIAQPTVVTTAASSISTTSATLGGNVNADGGATVNERGVVYSTTDATPTIAEGATKVAIGSGTGEFSENITGLNEGTTYYVSAYATNSEGTSYGNAETFTTNDILTNINGEEVSELFCYPNPTQSIVYLKNAKANTIIKVYNTNSQLIMQTKGHQIDLSEFAKGIYILDIDNTKFKVMKK